MRKKSHQWTHFVCKSQYLRLSQKILANIKCCYNPRSFKVPSNINTIKKIFRPVESRWKTVTGMRNLIDMDKCGHKSGGCQRFEENSILIFAPTIQMHYLCSWVYNVHCVDRNRLYSSASRFGLANPSRWSEDKEWRRSAIPWQLGAGLRTNPLGSDRTRASCETERPGLLSSGPSRSQVSVHPGMSNPGQYHRKKTKMA